MREWCVVFDTVSSADARDLGKALAERGADVDIEASRGRVWLFADTEAEARALERRALEIPGGYPSTPPLQCDPAIRRWNDERHRYVDPDAPHEDPDTREVWIDSNLDPSEVRWRVRLEVSSVFEFRGVLRQLPALQRPVVATGNHTIDLGVRDDGDAQEIAARAQALEGVASVHTSEIRGRIRRWLLRQRLASNYVDSNDGAGPPGYGYAHHFGWGGGGGGKGAAACSARIARASMSG